LNSAAIFEWQDVHVTSLAGDEMFRIVWVPWRTEYVPGYRAINNSEIITKTLKRIFWLIILIIKFKIVLKILLLMLS